MSRLNFRPLIALLLGLTLIASSAPAQDGAEQEPDRQTIRKLQAIKSALDDRRARVQDLVERINQANEADKQPLREQLAVQQQRIRELSESFEKTAVSGASLRSIQSEEPTSFDWRNEMLQITRPIFDGLKEATAKPRRMAELRASLDAYRQQLVQTDRAIESLARYRGAELPDRVASGLAELEGSSPAAFSDSSSSSRRACHEPSSSASPLATRSGSSAPR